MPTDAETITAFVERVEREHGGATEHHGPDGGCTASERDALQAARALRAIEMATRLRPGLGLLGTIEMARSVLAAGAAALKEGR